MRRYFPLVFFFALMACEQPVEQSDSGLEGVTFTSIGPAKIPYKGTVTIVVSDASGKAVSEIQTNSDGSFKINLSPGTYYLSVDKGYTVKTGPFTVEKGRFSQAEAYYDFGAV